MEDNIYIGLRARHLRTVLDSMMNDLRYNEHTKEEHEVKLAVYWILMADYLSDFK
jgi:hypothetical protein